MVVVAFVCGQARVDKVGRIRTDGKAVITAFLSLEAGTPHDGPNIAEDSGTLVATRGPRSVGRLEAG